MYAPLKFFDAIRKLHYLRKYARKRNCNSFVNEFATKESKDTFVNDPLNLGCSRTFNAKARVY